MQIIRQQNATKSHFFDYSLWNHYVNVRFCLVFSAAAALSFALYVSCALLFVHFVITS